MRVAAVLLVIVLAGVGCSSAEPDKASGAHAASAAPSTVVSEEPGTPVDGTWRTGQVDRVLLEEGGLTKHEIDVVLHDNGATKYIVSTLKLEDGNWSGFISADGGVDEPAQSGTFTVEGDTIVMLDPGIDARYRYRWSIKGGRLRIRLIESDAPGHLGIPDEAFQYALYESTPLEAVG